jgi:hypothetical protein
VLLSFWSSISIATLTFKNAVIGRDPLSPTTMAKVIQELKIYEIQEQMNGWLQLSLKEKQWGMKVYELLGWGCFPEG